MAESPQWWVGTDECGWHPQSRAARCEAAARTGGWRRWPPPSGRARSSCRPTAPRSRSCSTATRPTCGRCPWPVVSPSRVTTGRPLAAFWDDGNAVWSPDGTRLAFTQGGRVMVVAAAGGVPVECARRPAPVWLDDARLDRRRRPATTRTVLAVVDIADAWPRPIAARGCRLRDRRGVARPHSGGVHGVPPRRPRTASACTSSTWPRAQSRAVVHHAGFQLRSPAWSPDGTHLAFASEWPGWYEVFVVARARRATDRASSRPTRPTSPISRTRRTARSLLGVRSRHGVTDLVRVDVGSGAVARAGRRRHVVVAAHAARRLGRGGARVVHHAGRGCAWCRPTATIGELFAPTPAPVRAAPHVVPEHVTYESLDGMEVHGWLYRPAGATAATGRARRWCNRTAAPPR